MTQSKWPFGMGKHKVRFGITPRPPKPERMKRLNARLALNPDLAAQRMSERMKNINAKSFLRARHRHPKSSDDYFTALADFTETEDCSPVEAVPRNPRCIEIAERFNKTPDEVAHDINRVYLDSYKR
jgi:hypothetical protein